MDKVIWPEPGSVVWTIVTFLIIAWLIGRYGWKPILSGLKSREDSIRQDLETARSEREKSQTLLAEYQAAMTGAKKESAEIIQRAQDSASQIVDEARVKSREATQRDVDQARAEIERLSDAAKAELRQHVAALTAQATSRLIGQVVDAKQHEKLILDALKEDR